LLKIDLNRYFESIASVAFTTAVTLSPFVSAMALRDATLCLREAKRPLTIARRRPRLAVVRPRGDQPGYRC
jgi:hypothetical protein